MTGAAGSASVRIGLFGGTFDPVHVGHLRTAIEFRELLDLDRVHLIPSARPPHREAPAAGAADRLAMVERAAATIPGLAADDRELRRDGPSWTVATLRELRAELGDSAGLLWLLGADAFAALDSWHEWECLLDLAHLVVAERPGTRPVPSPAVADLLDRHLAEDPAALRGRPAGCILRCRFTLLDVSATALRRRCAEGRSIQLLVTDAVAI